ncbi:MAG TPA: hypothetical protein VK667_07075 [Ktedonobacteraceae bacterium]|nr:hypothetical protein [Ktedonobacteraceae bacterium]
MIVLQIIVFSLGFLIAMGTLYSATKQTVLPGRKKVLLSRTVFRTSFRLFRLVIVRIPSEQLRGTLSALNAPMSVMLLPLTWVILLLIGFTMMFWGVSEPSLGTALSLSGAAITTEGFLAPQGEAQTTVYIMGGVIGLGIVGLLITFLPTVYSIYSQREEVVTRVAFRFGSPPSGVKVLAQAYRSGLAQELDQFWRTWEDWFTDLAETHISNSEVIFYRSSQPGTSWITTAGAILDASALYSSTVDRGDVPWLNLCFQVGSRTLSDIATDVGIPPGSALAPGVSMHVTRAEYDAACEQLSSAGVRLKADREESWRAFVSMRSQYDSALIALAKLVYAPEAPWSSDRKLGLTARDLIR